MAVAIQQADPPDGDVPDRPFFLDPPTLRRAFGSFATGVTIVSSGAAGAVHGMTANSFISVSLDPALLLVSVDNRARMKEVLSATGWFGVSVLGAHQRELSQHFAGRPRGDLSVPFVWKRGVAVIDGAIAHFVCRLSETVAMGDHTLAIGAIEYASRQDGEPLLFFGGAYASMARADN